MIDGLRWFGPNWIMPEEEVVIETAEFGGTGVAPNWNAALVVLFVKGKDGNQRMLHLDMTANQVNAMQAALHKASVSLREFEAQRVFRREQSEPKP